MIGINSGTEESHKAFAQHHRLPFALLSDPGNRVLKLFGIKNLLFLTGRETFVIDLEGKIAFSFRGFLNGGLLSFWEDGLLTFWHLKFILHIDPKACGNQETNHPYFD